MQASQFIQIIKNEFESGVKDHMQEWSIAYQLINLREVHSPQLTTDQTLIIEALVFITSHRIQHGKLTLRYVENFPSLKFDKEQIKSVETFVKELDNVWLTAKFYDVLWSNMSEKKADYIMNCVSAYIRFPLVEILHTIEYWERGLFLAGTAKLKQQQSLIVGTLIQEALNNNNSFVIVRMLNQHKLLGMYAIELVDVLKSQIKNEIQKRGHWIAVEYWNLILDMGNKYNSLKSKKSSYIQSKAHALCSLAEHNKKINNIHVASDNYREAVIGLKSLSNDYKISHNIDEEIQKIERNLVDLRLQIEEQFKKIAQPIKVDISKEVEIAEDLIQGENLEELLQIPDLEYRHFYKVQRRVHKKEGVSFLNHLIGGSSYSDNDGRVLGTFDSTSEEVKKIECYRMLIEHSGKQAASYILPALRKFKKIKSLDEEEFYKLARSCSMVPDDQKRLMGKALWHGYREDFSTSIMLLCPLVESILRNILKESDIPTVDIDRVSESEKSMNKLLDIAKEKKILNQEVIFKIEAIFVSNFGLNFRNKVAHGLVSDNSASSLYATYVWWLCLKWVIIYSPGG
ncbi:MULTISPECIES: DUF4209 domain-containing protein [Vibrio]|uniref:DUF4209 domain-containing protein n=1 Tax=Vibrio kanaloae TaxID=170673 RepID=A0A4U1Z2N0_9VIBR|nr:MULTISPECIES: DUF4209 domain-containing protein [Vibrio]PHX07631.1 hypothetical protein VSPL_05690 [Vibrio splendidus]TKF27539.1 DUF4209 domain-containing protein [Vibrio kanaloae]